MIRRGDGDVRAARREEAFVRERRRERRRRHALPRRAAVGRRQDDELAVDRVADGHAALRVPERHRVEEGLRVAIDELLGPGAAGVRRLVDPRELARADAEHVGGLVVDGIDVAEVELLGAGNARASATSSPPSVVLRIVPFVPLAQATRSLTALTPRSLAPDAGRERGPADTRPGAWTRPSEKQRAPARSVAAMMGMAVAHY